MVRVTLIQAFLSSILVYYMSLFKVLASVIERLEDVMRNFVWAVNGEKK